MRMNKRKFVLIQNFYYCFFFLSSLIWGKCC